MDISTNPLNEDFESYNIEDDEEERPSDERLTMWALMPSIMCTPASGWAKVRHSGPSPDIATIRFLLPLCLLSGAACFLSLLYPHDADTGFAVMLVEAVVELCSFFLGYYVAQVVAKLLMPKDDRHIVSTDYGKLLIMAGVATIALFHILFVAFPMIDFILGFLPIWTLFIQFKGMELIKFKSDKRLLSMAVICLATVASPAIIEWILMLFV